jgi:hypothetical protein
MDHLIIKYLDKKLGYNLTPNISLTIPILNPHTFIPSKLVVFSVGTTPLFKIEIPYDDEYDRSVEIDFVRKVISSNSKRDIKLSNNLELELHSWFGYNNTDLILDTVLNYFLFIYRKRNAQNISSKIQW